MIGYLTNVLWDNVQLNYGAGVHEEDGSCLYSHEGVGIVKYSQAKCWQTLFVWLLTFRTCARSCLDMYNKGVEM
jgi:hypothetical protein